MTTVVDGAVRSEVGRQLFRTMALIRAFERQVGKAFNCGEIPGFIHLSIGQEAVSAGVAAALDERDKVTSTHRGHGHCLAVGSDPKRVMAEIYAREDGLCHGRGGTMHLYDLDHGLLGTNGIVGAGGPLACGAALAQRIAGSGGVVVTFMGDGATDQGATHEAMNLAALWSLPVVFVVENNGFSEGTPLASHTTVPRLVDRAAAYSMPGVRVDGQDAFAVLDAATDAVARGRAGGGPTLLEAVTSRFGGHFEGDGMKYHRDDADADAATRDPLTVLRAVLEAASEDPAALDEELSAAEAIVREAREFARASAHPDPASVADFLFASPVGGDAA